MNKFTKKILLNVIKTTCNKRGRKCSKENSHYLDEIFTVLKTGKQWNQINNTLHSDTYYKKFIYWNKNNIFQTAYNLMITILKNNKYINHQSTKELFTDTSMIKNIKGMDMLGKNHYDRFRNANKVSVIVTNNGIPLSIHITAANIHDSKVFEPTLQNINFKLLGSNKYPKYMVADKGYNYERIKECCKNNNLILVVPNKKNYKKQAIFNSYKKDILKKRHIVENFFAWLKNYKRIKNRYEKHIENYSSFVYFACINITMNKLY